MVGNSYLQNSYDGRVVAQNVLYLRHSHAQSLFKNPPWQSTEENFQIRDHLMPGKCYLELFFEMKITLGEFE